MNHNWFFFISALLVADADAFHHYAINRPCRTHSLSSPAVVVASRFNVPSVSLCAIEAKKENIDLSGKEKDSLDEIPTIKAAGSEPVQSTEEADEEETGQAETGTVNERLLAELKQAEENEKYGARSSMGKKLGLDAFKSTKTDEERKKAIEEARNLNGVNPLVTFAGACFALAAAYGLWAATTFLGVWFAQHPADTDVFIVQRSVAVFRNVVVGLASLASGFFGVTGLGIMLLTFRVASGIVKGELDPTPIVQQKPLIPEKGDDFELGSAWDLMRGKSGTRRRK